MAGAGTAQPQAERHPSPWDEHLLFAPLDTLTRPHRALAVVLTTAFALLWAALRNGDLMAAWALPDVHFYVLLAQGHLGLVPAPFTARPLAPWLAGRLAALLHTWTEGGFEVLGFLCLLWTVAVVAALAVRTSAPRWVLLALAVVPFWAQLLGDAGLPDPLYAALLCCLLLALASRRLLLAAALLLPLMLTRESTSLTLVCLLLVAWRPLGWRGCTLAVAGTAVGAAIVRRLSLGSLPNPEHLSGATYLVGKVASNSLRSLGLVPWSNVYPALCPTPAWQMPLHLGPVRAVGVCRWTPVLLMPAWWSVLTVFGLLPLLLLLAFWPASRSGAKKSLQRLFTSDVDLLLRFSVLYGGISLLLGPTLGVSYTRLVGYGWPLLLVALPRLWARARVLAVSPSAAARDRTFAGLLLVLHLLVSALGLRFARGRTMLPMLCLEALAAALLWTRRRHALAGRMQP